MKLSGTEFVALKKALLDTFVSDDDLKDVLRVAEIPADRINFRGTLRASMTGVIEITEAQDRIPELIAIARASNPTNVALMEVANSVGVIRVPDAGGGAAGDLLTRSRLELERMVAGERGIQDLGKFAARMQDYVQRVCAIELGEEGGTGFLIGPRTVLTNHHVVEKVIKKKFPADEVVLRFDYRRDRDGLVTNEGTPVGLAKDWLVHTSEYSAFDLTKYVEGTAPGAKELDYAVLRLKTALGSEPLFPFDGSPQRGWVKPRTEAYEFPTDSYLMIVQHPCHDPISHDFANDATIRVVGDFLRVHYRVNTMPGSSGSPVLDHNLDLVALHHAGEPGSPDGFLPCKQQLTPATYNQGIPIATIQQHLEAHDLGWVFGQEQP
jgi:V8-like Glu-specific endopeptidase